jgi:hypothetical protein
MIIHTKSREFYTVVYTVPPVLQGNFVDTLPGMEKSNA